MGHVYAISDLHGCWYNFEETLKILQPNDIVYCLGDCGDRGKDGWKIIKAVLNDKRFIYLRGNHEDMLCKTINTYYKIKKNCLDEYETMFNLKYEDDFLLMEQNGGEKTFKDWKKDPNKNFYYQRLKELPIIQSYLNKKGQTVILSHAGFTPHIDETPSEDTLIWNRFHFNQKWDEFFPDSIIIHGHTPIPYFDEFLYDVPREYPRGAFWYCDNHKINIDCGTVFTGISTIINLNTWEEYIITNKEVM